MLCCVGIPSVVWRDDCYFWCVSRSLCSTFAPRVPKGTTNNKQFDNKKKVSGCDNIRLHSVQLLPRGPHPLLGRNTGKGAICYGDPCSEVRSSPSVVVNFGMSSALSKKIKSGSCWSRA